MDKQKNTNKRLSNNKVSLIVTAVIAVCFVVSILGTVKNNGKQTCDILLLGDSIVGKERDYETVDSRIAQITGKSVYNGAFGGSCAVSLNADNRYDYHEDSLNLCRLVDAICEGDFGVQLADLPNNQFASGYFLDSMKNLADIDYNTVDVFVLEHGTNDYLSGCALDNPEDEKDVHTYGGALRYAIERLQEKFPEAEIVLVTPVICYLNDYGTADRHDFGSGTMEAYADKKIEIAKQYGVKVIDAYRQVGFNEENILGNTEDGLHLNEDGRKVYGDFLGNELQKILEEE